MYKEFKDYYSILEIGFDASEAEIKAAFRKLARSHHPDLHPDETERYTALFQEVTEAYDTLSDPEKRATYDFRYRQMVLGEGPQYEYVEDDTPQDTRQYRHTYTRHRPERTIPFIRIAVALLIGFQVIRSLSQTASIEPEYKYGRPFISTPGAATDEIRNLLRHSSLPDSSVRRSDSILFTGGNR